MIEERATTQQSKNMTDTLSGKFKTKEDGQECIQELCNICCDKFSVSRRRRVRCLHCDKSACVQCVKTYILGTMEDAHCMFCRCHWNREFLDETLSQYFRTKQYKIHRENILCEREKARLHETQALYTTVKERMDLWRKEKKSLDAKVNDLAVECQEVQMQYIRKINDCQVKIRQKDRQIAQLHEILNGNTDTVPGDATFITDTFNKITRFLLPCPGDTCNAFIDDTYICALCQIKICKHCHIRENDDHICKEEDVASIRQLRKDTKNCPGCHAMIHRIDGCDQMWCTICHTAFSWKTGVKIENVQIHNPHFYEWKRENGGLHVDGPVDINGCPILLIDLRSIQRKIASVCKVPFVPQVIRDIHGEISEILDTHLQNRVVQPDPTRNLRIEFLTGVLQENEWKYELQKHEKNEMKVFERMQVLEMYTTTMKDLFREIVNAETISDMGNIQLQMVSLLKYVHSNLLKINNRYGSTAIPQYAKQGDRLASLNCFRFFGN